MHMKRLAVSLAVGLAAVVLCSCGNGDSTTVTPKPGNGALYILIGDTPICDALSFRASVTGLTLTPQDSETVVPVIGAASLIKLNFASLRDLVTVLSLGSVQAGTYDKVTITFSRTELGLFDPTEDPPSRVQGVVFSTLAPEIPIDPPLTVVENKVSVLRLDFDMLRSLERDSQDQITGNVTPFIKAVPVVANEEGYGDLNNLVGFVRTVSPSRINDTFIGSMNVQLLGGTGPSATVILTEETGLFGAPALNELETGRFVEVQAYLDPDGNIVARNIEVENRAVVEESKVAFLGFVNSVTRDADGNLTQFNLHVREEEPDVSLSVFLDHTVVVNVLPETTFQTSSRDTNFADLPFDAANLAVGQEVVVHGTYTLNTDALTTVDADSIYLRLQTLQGNLSSLVRVESDGRSGAFELAPCCTLLQGAPILAITNSETAFLNVFGLADLRPEQTLLVIGLPFFLPDGGTINGVTVPAGSIAVLTKQVHQLE